MIIENIVHKEKDNNSKYLSINLIAKTKNKKCTAKKGDYPCTIWGCPWCNECALYK